MSLHFSDWRGDGEVADFSGCMFQRKNHHYCFVQPKIQAQDTFPKTPSLSTNPEY
jgi:hypothetical protein